jgi:hypothetical protein
MKKFLLGLVISLLAFFCGIITFGLINFENKNVSRTEVSQLAQELKIQKSSVNQT